MTHKETRHISMLVGKREEIEPTKKSLEARLKVMGYTEAIRFDVAESKNTGDFEITASGDNE